VHVQQCLLGKSWEHCYFGRQKHSKVPLEAMSTSQRRAHGRLGFEQLDVLLDQGVACGDSTGGVARSRLVAVDSDMRDS
jgi:hypothetical protein